MLKFNKQLQAQLALMCGVGKLFRSEMTGDQVWDLYLKSFEDDPTFRDPESSEHNCNLCKSFVRRYGNIVAITPANEVLTLFDFEGVDEFLPVTVSLSNEFLPVTVSLSNEFLPVTVALSNALRKAPVANIFMETYDELNSLPYEVCKKTLTQFRLGTASNTKRYTREEAEKFGVVTAGQEVRFNHMHLDMPAMYVDKSGKSEASIMADYRAAKEVFQRAMEEIHIDTLNLVKDLIVQGSLLDGQAHLFKVEQFIPLKKEYDTLAANQRDVWCWLKSYGLPIAKFRNELLGVLCSELSEGKELNAAVQSWNKRVDPANYMKAVAPITKKQIEQAQKFVEENGYTESFNRRFAILDDIKVSEILHTNAGDGSVPSVSIFDSVKPATSTRHKRSEFDDVKEVSIESFMKDILPSCTSVEAFLANSHGGNMVTLTTANIPDSKPIFKWDNNYSWTFNGNLAGKSQIAEAVKNLGGAIDGVLRFSIMWADGDDDQSDLDAHCVEPKGHIYFGDKRSRSGGSLDVDIRHPDGRKPAAENIVYPNITAMPDGTFKFQVHQYSARKSKGFKAEIAVNGETYSYEYNQPVSGYIPVAEVTLKNGVFTIVHKLPECGVSSREIYGLQSNEFHKVNLVCLSPNHWGDNNVGNKHYFFMLDKCKSPTSIRSFHAENLIPELAEHRKVLEVLGNTTMIEPADKQLSGLGFNATVRDELIVKVQGSFKRMLKIKF